MLSVFWFRVRDSYMGLSANPFLDVAVAVDSVLGLGIAPPELLK